MLLHDLVYIHGSIWGLRGRDLTPIRKIGTLPVNSLQNAVKFVLTQYHNIIGALIFYFRFWPRHQTFHKSNLFTLCTQSWSSLVARCSLLGQRTNYSNTRSDRRRGDVYCAMLDWLRSIMRTHDSDCIYTLAISVHLKKTNLCYAVCLRLLVQVTLLKRSDYGTVYTQHITTSNRNKWSK